MQKEVLDPKMNKIRTTLEKFFVDSLNTVNNSKFWNEKFDENTHEKKLTDSFYFFLNALNWKTWNSDYQEIIKDIRRYYIFSNLKEDTEIIIEFMRSYNENETGKIHLEKKYQEKNKLKTKKIVLVAGALKETHNYEIYLLFYFLFFFFK